MVIDHHKEVGEEIRRQFQAAKEVIMIDKNGVEKKYRTVLLDFKGDEKEMRESCGKTL